MTGTITRRGKSSWRLKYDLPRDAETGERRIAYRTVKGTKKAAERELRKCLSAIDEGIVIEPTGLTIGEYLDKWLDKRQVGANTLERYRGLAKKQIKPHLGKIPLQKLRPLHIQDWHADLIQEGRISIRTIQNAHHVLKQTVGDAAVMEIVPRNVVALVRPPRGQKQEVTILTPDEIADVLGKIKGDFYAVVETAFATGMRRGELAALRWQDIDIDAGKLRVENSFEETRAGTLTLKAPKTTAGRRTITLPARTVAVLRQRKRERMEVYLQLGGGRLPEDGFVFGNVDGTPRGPRWITDTWIKRKGIPKVKFHSLRHSHASVLIANGVDMVTIAKRLGHANAAITLSTYGHMVEKTDDLAAAVIDRVLK